MDTTKELAAKLEAYAEKIRGYEKLTEEIYTHIINSNDCTSKTVMYVVAGIYRRNVKLMQVKSNAREVVEMKHAYAFLMYCMFGFSYSDIGKLISSDRSTMNHSVSTFIQDYKYNEAIQDKFNKVVGKEKMEQMIHDYYNKKRKFL